MFITLYVGASELWLLGAIVSSGDWLIDCDWLIDSNPDFRINSDSDVCRIVPQTLLIHYLVANKTVNVSANLSVISPSVVKIGWWLYEKR